MVLQEFAIPEQAGHAVGFEKGSREACDAGHTVARSRWRAHGHYEKYR